MKGRICTRVLIRGLAIDTIPALQRHRSGSAAGWMTIEHVAWQGDKL